MSGERIDIQVALDELTKRQYRLQEAFLGFASWAATSISDRSDISYGEIATNLEELAEMAANQERAITGRDAPPNPYLASVAQAMRGLESGHFPPPFGVIDGGKDD